MKRNSIFLGLLVICMCGAFFWGHRYTTQHMKIYEYHTDLFKHEQIQTEYNAYKLLKVNPLKKNVNYLAIPWSVLINGNMLSKVPNITLNGGFTICQHIQFERIIPTLKRIGIDTLFTPHVSKHAHYDGIQVLPFPHWDVNSTDPAAEKDLWYSFIGWPATHPTRTVLFNLPETENTFMKKRQGWHFWQNEERKKYEKNEYSQILARSRFSLCPRGTGPSTVRFWESLRSLSIPILISDDMALPKGFDWDSCIVQIPEHETHKLNNILKSISPEQEQKMRENCLQCYKQFLGSNFDSTIRHHYERTWPWNLFG